VKKILRIKKIQNAEELLDYENSSNKDKNAVNEFLTNEKPNENLTYGNVDRLETSSDFINLERKIPKRIK
jgi:hypothetical protein